MIKFFNVDHASSNSLPHLNNHLNDRKHKIFLFTYMDGCGPCNETKPMWDRLPLMQQQIRRLNEPQHDIIIAKVNEKSFGSLVPRLGEKPMAFPSISFFSDFKKKDEFNGMRNPNEFIKWINNSIQKDITLKKKGKTKKRKQIKKKRAKSKTRKR
jgi:hypothetical protein